MGRRVIGQVCRCGRVRFHAAARTDDHFTVLGVTSRFDSQLTGRLDRATNGHHGVLCIGSEATERDTCALDRQRRVRPRPIDHSSQIHISTGQHRTDHGDRTVCLNQKLARRRGNGQLRTGRNLDVTSAANRQKLWRYDPHRTTCKAARDGCDGTERDVTGGCKPPTARIIRLARQNILTHNRRRRRDLNRTGQIELASQMHARSTGRFCRDPNFIIVRRGCEVGRLHATGKGNGLTSHVNQARRGERSIRGDHHGSFARSQLNPTGSQRIIQVVVNRITNRSGNPNISLGREIELTALQTAQLSGRRDRNPDRASIGVHRRQTEITGHFDFAADDDATSATEFEVDIGTVSLNGTRDIRDFTAADRNRAAGRFERTGRAELEVRRVDHQVGLTAHLSCNPRLALYTTSHLQAAVGRARRTELHRRSVLLREHGVTR